MIAIERTRVGAPGGISRSNATERASSSTHAVNAVPIFPHHSSRTRGACPPPARANGVPVPHVYGLAEGPGTLVMTRVPGQQGLALARDDATRRALMTTYIEHIGGAPHRR